MKMTTVDAGLNTMSLEKIPSGMYFIEGVNPSIRVVKKLIIKE